MRVVINSIAICLVIAFSRVVFAADGAADLQLLDSLIQAWSARQNSMQSGEIEWTTVRFRGSELMEIMAIDTGPEGPPVENTTLNQSYRLLFDRGKVRFEIDKAIWSEKQRKYIKVPYLSTFDGEMGKNLWPQPADSTHPLGMIVAETEHPDIRSVPLAPMMLACQPLSFGNPAFDFAPDQLRNNWAIERLNGRPAIKLRRQTGYILVEVWLDASPDFRLVQFANSSQGRVISNCKLEYGKADHPFIPSGWQLENFGGQGQLLARDEARVTKVVFNPVIEADAFKLEFPVGCYVDDQRTKKRYIVQSPDKLREVLRTERKLSHGTLMNTETGAVFANSHILTYAVCGLLLVFITAVGFRVWHRRLVHMVPHKE